MAICTPQNVTAKRHDQWGGATKGLYPRLSSAHPYAQRPYENPYDRPLATLEDITGAFIGGFNIDHSINGANTDGAPIKINSSTARLAYNAKNHSIFTTSQAGGRDNDSIIELALPPFDQLTTDPATFPTASTIIQGWATVLNNGRIPVEHNAYDEIGGMYYDPDRNELVLNIYYSYTGGDSSAAVVIIEDANDIANSNVLGAWKTDGMDEACNWPSELEAAWKYELNATHIYGNGAGMSNQQRLSNGPSAWATNHDLIDRSGAYTQIPQTKLMSFPYGQFGDPAMGTALHGDLTHTRGNKNEYNNAAKSGEAYEYASDVIVASPPNDVWTRVSSAAFGCHVFNTSTYVSIGQVTGGEKGAGYKLKRKDEAGVFIGTDAGPGPADHDDAYPYYWLFSMKEMRDAVDKSSVLPYAYGKFPTALAMNELPRSGLFDPRTGYMFISCAEGAYGSSGSVIQVLVFKFEV